jgi:putative transposase
MPRQARLDIPGYLYHIIARGLDRRPIFYDEEDRKDFLSRVEKAIEQVPTQIYAWALMPNHFHFLVQGGERGLAPFHAEPYVGLRQ